ncbi:uncharacterized mitochondrial protein AtMg00810-like [Manihot esculenta]|uniref:uncharacterized mitochondrial protein AtMg00810-like n=1 Tax=Manihot esculenta TaxID=3983 RepID=UPI000B5D7321|nr:uncharacterized mitochondrial protein AtMg00810-like [Manihot esculenta]
MDVHNAFLHGKSQKEVYMKIPPGFGSSSSGEVCRLLITGNDLFAIQKFKEYLNRCFYMKDLGKLKYFLELEVACTAEGLFLYQSATPLEQNHKLALTKGAEFTAPTSYRRLVGRLIYLAITRSKLSYCVHILAQFMQRSLQVHYAAALQVVHYLQGQLGQSILMHANCNLALIAYCDFDWANCPLTYRSLTGYFILLGGSPISWKAKNQLTMSRSSTEAEYRCMTTTAFELKLLKGLLISLGVSPIMPMQLYCDSRDALHIAANTPNAKSCLS